ncbi:MAG: methyltransferase domain-containing protein [Chitinophagales bacterium]|nr:methyltransferase domain-containing protein [Chitinophagales bacterium]MCB9021805.1 methyltransferase domain-containing protein [Chitinophagales bacterium]HPE96332.1 methyltransferase domain-containing protein [Chitinophagales bacterium]HQU39093.1 methyltransferase domain-containing protein [Chitinophagales bacterium]HQU76909.1 methyltransferase domain-containing protein [Chitinophagales bacterium]
MERKKPYSAWQYWQSFLYPVRLDQKNSSYSGEIRVDLVGGRCQLHTGNAIYSYEDRYTSFMHALGVATFEDDCRVLVLGMGLGSIPYLLFRTFHHRGLVTCIEIDPDIIGLAKKYYPPSAPVPDIIQADAVTWLQQNKLTFDLITMDMFIGEEVPYECWQTSFLSDLKRAVAPGGALLFSRLKEREVEEQDLWKNLAETFPGAAEIPTSGNSIMYWRYEDDH